MFGVHVRGSSDGQHSGDPALAGSGQPSALGQAVLLGLEIDSLTRHVRSLNQALTDLRRSQEHWAAGAAGEASVIQVLVGMDDARWRILADRRWPGTRHSNIDVLLAGPGGVFVMDVKAWKQVRVEAGRLWHGQAPADDALDKLLAQVRAVEDVLAGTGLVPAEITPLLVLAGRRGAQAPLGRVIVLGERDLTLYLARRGARLTPPQVEQVVAALDEGCPPWSPDGTASPARRAAGARPDGASGRDWLASADPAGSAGGPGGAGEQGALVSRAELERALVEAAAAEPLESWMTWLHPAQARLVSRPFSGPARIRGAAGTGKTVVALHRARYLAARGDRVLFTSFLKTLAPVGHALFARIAPGLADRVEFASVHAVALRYLKAAGADPRYVQASADACWGLAWKRAGQQSSLARTGRPPDYWRAEVVSFIEGGGITSFGAYAARPRTGRRTPLQPAQREDVWRLYECYRDLLAEREIVDGSGLLRRARDLARQAAGPDPGPRFDAGPQPRFDAVIVDEAQDLPVVGLQFLHALAGDKPDGLLIVGDGQQSIYAGGGTLAEAGISVSGRSAVLRRNYRNRADILRHALGVVAGDQFADLEAEPYPGTREVEATRPGGLLVQAAGTPAAQGAALGRHLRELAAAGQADPGEIAVLVPTRAAAERWLALLRTEGIAAGPLAIYDGYADGRVKVGTYHRAKGLEFAWVCLPDRDQHPAPPRTGESEEAWRERAEVERRQLFVAMTRARDGLWIGTREPPRLAAAGGGGEASG